MSICRTALLAWVLQVITGCSSYPDEASIFDYDPSARLEVETAGERSGRGFRCLDMSFASPDSGRVPAYLFLPWPASERPAPALVMMHGSPGTRASLNRLAESYARAGVVVLSPSAPFNRHRQVSHRDARLVPAPLFNRFDRLELIQLVRELRRALDYLEARPDVDADRLAFVGHSYGGWAGSLLASVESRLQAVVLMAPTNGYSTWLTLHEGEEDHLIRRALDQLEPREQTAWLDSIEPLEGARWIGRTLVPAVLIQAGRYDRSVLEEETLLLHAASPETSRLIWYDAEHKLNTAAFRDQAAYLSGLLGFDMSRFEAPEGM